jgi:hypothetical protein
MVGMDLDSLWYVVLEHAYSVGNAAEAVLWFGIGCGFLIALRRARYQRLKWVAGLTFIAFGFSDLVEIQTEAWWRPWWLLAWKAVCVGVLLWTLIAYRKQSRASSPTKPED